MSLKLLPLIALVIINLLLDQWLYRYLRRSKHLPRLKSVAHGVLSVLLMVVILVAAAIPFRDCPNVEFRHAMWLLYIYYTFYVPRYVAALAWLPTHLKRSGKRTRHAGQVVATLLGIAVFAFMWWGALVSPYQVKVERVNMEFENLPPEFDGYRIVQFSDTHLGSYCDTTHFISTCVDTINSLKPDMICFTGDLVNRRTVEAKLYKKDLSRLHAPDGVISILGNHDETSYFNWSFVYQRQRDLNQFIDLQRKMGWTVLNNDHIILRRDSSEVAVVGTRCYGEWPLPRKHNLDVAYPDYDSGKRFVILLQHDPRQWKLDKAYKDKEIDFRVCDKVDLMLAGHTHAMQCMFNVFGYKISPAVFQTKEWGGLYSEGDHKLYVNIGIGMVGMPARLGSATPEITLITLHAKKKKNNP